MKRNDHDERQRRENRGKEKWGSVGEEVPLPRKFFFSFFLSGNVALGAGFNVSIRRVKVKRAEKQFCVPIVSYLTCRTYHT